GGPRRRGRGGEGRSRHPSRLSNSFCTPPVEGLGKCGRKGRYERPFRPPLRPVGRGTSVLLHLLAPSFTAVEIVLVQALPTAPIGGVFVTHVPTCRGFADRPGSTAKSRCRGAGARSDAALPRCERGGPRSPGGQRL